MTGSAAGVAVRIAGAADLPAMAALEAACFASPWSAELLAAEVAAPGALALVAAIPAGEHPRGYALFRSVLDEAELLRVAVHPAGRRCGIATQLLARGGALLAARGCRRVFLEVSERNAPAIAVYERLGWRRDGRRPGYYSDGAAALLYSATLAAP